MRLRAYQENAIEELRRAMAMGARRVLLTIPTGGGKTEIAKAIIERAIAKGKRVFFTCPRIELIKQTSARFLRHGIDHGVIQANHVMTNPDKPVQVCSIQTLNRRLWNNFDLIIIDEAHGATAPIYRKFLGRRQPSGYHMIGLTATPFTRGLGAYCKEVGGPLFEKLIVGATIRQLINDGFLVDVEIWGPSEPDLTGVKISGGDYNEAQLAERVDKPQLIGDIVNHWKKLADGKRTILFATNIAHSKHIVDMFRAADVPAEHIDAYTPSDERDRILARLASGETLIVSNVSVLAEGFDLPAIECMVLARPTRSMTRYIQMVGRALRPAPGKEKAIIIDHSGTVRRLGWPTEDIEMELDDGKPRGPQKKRPPLPKVCPSCAYIVPRGISTCGNCGFIFRAEPKLRHGEGSLEQMTPKKISTEEKQQIFSAIIGELERRRSIGRKTKDGWVAHVYRDITGVWPRGLKWRPGPMVDSVREAIDARRREARLRAMFPKEFRRW